MEKYYCIYIYISWKYNFNWKKKFILWERYSVFIKLIINLDETTVIDSFIQLHEFEEDTPISCITNIQFWFRLSNFLVELYDNFTTIFKQSLNNFKLEYTWIRTNSKTKDFENCHGSKKRFSFRVASRKPRLEFEKKSFKTRRHVKAWERIADEWS